MKVLVTQSYLTFCSPKDYSPPSCSVHGILQRLLEWVTISFSRGSSQPRGRTWVSCIAGRFFIQILKTLKFRLLKPGHKFQTITQLAAGISTHLRCIQNWLGLLLLLEKSNVLPKLCVEYMRKLPSYNHLYLQLPATPAF